MKAARTTRLINALADALRVVPAIPMVRRPIAIACLALFTACGMRSGMLVLGQDGGEEDQDSSVPSRAAGGAAGAGANRGTGGHAGTGGSSLPGYGGTRVGSGGAAGTGVLGGRGGSGGIAIAAGGSLGRGGSNAGSSSRPGAGGAWSPGDAGPLRPDALEVGRPVGTPSIDPDNNYVTINAGTVVLSGTVVSACAGSGTICGGPTYTDSSFCVAGTVGASPTYKSWANAGFTVNQSKSGTSGSTSSLPFVGSSITLSYSNPGRSTLEFQLWDGSNYWCYYLPPSTGANTVTIPFSKLNSSCWDGSGTAFASGTPVDSVQFVVPCSATTSTPFNYCFLGLTIQ
jgi:hypothetical protein